MYDVLFDLDKWLRKNFPTSQNCVICVLEFKKGGGRGKEMIV
jgi:hypothetical protein